MKMNELRYLVWESGVWHLEPVAVFDMTIIVYVITLM